MCSFALRKRVVGLAARAAAFGGGVALALAVSAAAQNAIEIDAASGSISAPFTLGDGSISQSVQTSLTNGGRAVYNFTVATAGRYGILARVNAPATNAN